ncbi:hypothetical protein [Yoonia sp. 2307UL14-13]|uniref:hypothetical protein n=1 Tax=Yoonia sp. 2307UL14-13 TaxID=3126506 RepID=UPI0030986AEA
MTNPFSITNYSYTTKQLIKGKADKVIKRHQDLIESELELLLTKGLARFSKEWLRVIHGQERFSKSIFRDLMDRLPEDYTVDDLHVFEWKDDIIIIESACMKKAPEVI